MQKNEISFGKEEYQLLISLKSEVAQCELNHSENVAKIDSLEKIIIAQTKELAIQKKTIDTMVWASSKVGFFVAGLCGGMLWLGNWLMNAVNFQAVKNFFEAINKGQ